MIIPIATFLTGTLSGIMLAGNDKDLKTQAMNAATKIPVVSAAPTPIASAPVNYPTYTAPVKPMVVNNAQGAVPIASADPIVGYGGKLAPPPAPQPEI